MELCGWSVQMNAELYDDILGQRVFEALRSDLMAIQSALPTAAVNYLKQVVFWLELDEVEFPGGVYHPSRSWLLLNAYPVKWEKGVQLGNAKNYLNWTKQQPAMVLHELAHAYDHLKFKNSNEQIITAFEAAKTNGIYEEVAYVGSDQLVRAYALSNVSEYFAELSEAYFLKNDFYPFNRTELEKHDKLGFKAMQWMWEQ